MTLYYLICSVLYRYLVVGTYILIFVYDFRILEKIEMVKSSIVYVH